MLARSDTDRERTPETGRDHPVGVVLVDDPDREGAAQHPRRGAHRTREIHSSTHLAVYQIGDDLRVGFGSEDVTVRGELTAQRFMVLDDAVVHHRDPVPGDMGMGVALVRRTVGRPTGMRDPDPAPQGLRFEHVGEPRHLAGGTPAIELRVLVDDRQAGGVVAPVLQSP